MAKIKGWLQMLNQRDIINYVRTTGYGGVLIHYDYGKRYWNVSIKGKNIDEQTNFKTKKESLDYAIKYMRANPNG